MCTFAKISLRDSLKKFVFHLQVVRTLMYSYYYVVLLEQKFRERIVQSYSGKLSKQNIV